MRFAQRYFERRRVRIRTAWTPRTTFIFLLVGCQVMIHLYGLKTIGHLAYHVIPPIHHLFFYFWHGDDPNAFGLLTYMMTVNVLAVMLLWSDFRAYRPSYARGDVAPYVFYAGSAVLLLLLQYLNWRVSQASPPGRLIAYDLTVPVALP